MVRNFCPHCNQVYIVQPHSGDYVHQCNSGNDTLDNEDKVMVGTYEDTLGNTIELSTKEQMIKSAIDQSVGTKAGVIDKNLDVENVTKRGKRKSTHVTMQKFQYIEDAGNVN